MESERLNSFRFNQDKLRVEQNALLREALANEVDPGNVGRISIMPSSFTNSKRYLTEYAQDGMINIRVYGRGKLSDHDHQPGVARDEGGPLSRPFFLAQSQQAGRDSKGVQAESGQVDGAHKEEKDLRPVSFLSQMTVQYLTSAKSNVFFQGEVLPIQHRVAEARLTLTSSIGLAYK